MAASIKSRIRQRSCIDAVTKATTIPKSEKENTISTTTFAKRRRTDDENLSRILKMEPVLHDSEGEDIEDNAESSTRASKINIEATDLQHTTEIVTSRRISEQKKPEQALRTYKFTDMKADYNISTATWLSMTEELAAYQVHNNLFPSMDGETRETILRIMTRHGINQKILNGLNNVIFRKFRQVLVVNRAHLKEQLVRKIKTVFNDLTFSVIVPLRPASYETMTIRLRRIIDKKLRHQIALQHREVIKHLANHYAFIYELDHKRQMLINKFQGPYITNTIAILFIGPEARIPLKTEKLSASLLAAVCTLLEYLVTDYAINKFTEVDWAPKYTAWINQIQAADARGKIDWALLLHRSRLALQDDPVDDKLKFEELPDEVHIE